MDYYHQFLIALVQGVEGEQLVSEAEEAEEAEEEAEEVPLVDILVEADTHIEDILDIGVDIQDTAVASIPVVVQEEPDNPE